ncbi:hypothetical protein FQA39_LY05422 [Lamprigera yunnana]|nr:hypothetical protein FQA39_LY05422 [Lamprigera yunnana]
MCRRLFSQLVLSDIPTLYYSHVSPPARATYMLIKTLGIDVNIKNVDLMTKDYVTPDLLKANPQHTIPTLVDGNYSIWDSHAISGYLVNQYGKNDSLYPINPRRRAVVDQRLHFDTEHLFPKINEIIHPILFRGKRDIPLISRKKVMRTYLTLENFLTTSLWLAGGDLTIADICCIASITTLDYVIPICQKTTPNLYEYMKRCSRLPHYDDTIQTGVDHLGGKIQENLITSYIKHYTVNRNSEYE